VRVGCLPGKAEAHISAISHHWNQLKPAEHGSWSLLLTPYLIGVGLAAVVRPSNGAPLPLALFTVLALAVFLARQPVGTLLRIQRGRARRAGLPLAGLWALGLGLLAIGCGAGLLASGRGALLPLAIPALITLAASLAISALAGPRGLALEIVGSLGLALAAPGALAAMTGTLDGLALVAWSISAAHSLVSILYVRWRIAARHDRASQRMRAVVVMSHVVVFAGGVAGGLAGTLPWSLALPFGLLLARAVWVAWRTPPLTDVRRFGFGEMGLALAFAALVVLAYAAPR